MISRPDFRRPAARLALLAALAGMSASLSGCAALLLGGAAGTVMVATERRTVGAQADDQAIEVKAANRMPDAIKGARGVSVISYNRRALLVGQVADQADRLAAERAVAGLDNVRAVYNELQVGQRADLQANASDAYLTTRVKAALVDTKGVSAKQVKVVTEGSTVYLMGLLTETEGRIAAAASSRVPGVKRVVTFFETITEAEAERLQRGSGAQGATPAPAETPAAPMPVGDTGPAGSGAQTTPIR